ncbi:MAG: HYExAFE family protein [Planctomycetaceae bacterium]|nr:HYExAFE family protein [Planctomycetaceae bacterium]
MAIRTNHYDVAFEELLREVRRPYVAVDERRRALAAEASLKSFDFVVYSEQGANLIVDVKGRQYPSAGRQRWRNWANQEDIDSLLKWEQTFGDNFRSLLLFTYELTEPRWWSEHSLVWEFRNRRYAFYGVWVRDYAQAMFCCSPSWQTVALRADDFRRLKMDIFELL